MEEIGEICETGGEITMQWKIKDFSSLHQEIDKRYEGPRFYFSGASWCIRLYPNGETGYESNDWLGLYVVKKSSGSSVSLEYSLGLKKSDGQNDFFVTSTADFDEKDMGWGKSKTILKTVLIEKKSEYLPSDILTAVCTLKNSNSKDVAGSLFSRLQELSDNLSDVYLKSKKTDFHLKIDDRRIPAHRLILESRSPVFAAMLSHDTKENQTGEVTIEDVDLNTMHNLLTHMYSGDIIKLTRKNVLSLYAAADKYDVKVVKDMCSEFIIRNLSVEWVLDVIKFADLHQNEAIQHRCREYFKENADKILETANWDAFVQENHGISVELLATLVKSMFKK